MNAEAGPSIVETVPRRGPWARRPSLGFVLLAGSFAVVAVFFLWALREPELDRLWRTLHELKIGKLRRLSGSELDRLHETLARYPELGPSLLDGKAAGLISANTGGWVETERAYLLASPGADVDPVVTFHWRPESGGIPGGVVLRGAGGEAVTVLDGPGTVTLGLSKAMRAGGVIEVRTDGPADPGLEAGLQVVFEDGDR